MEIAECGDDKSPPEGWKKAPEGGDKPPKRKMKSPYQLEILEKTYAVETYPSETLRADLSAKTGLSDRQLQMWFCHRRLKDRKYAPVKRAKKEEGPLPPLPVSASEVVIPPVSSSVGPGSAPFAASGGEPRKAMARVSPAISRIGAEISLGKRYYEPPILPPQPPQLSFLELRIISSVEGQLGEPLREDGPILGVDFDPLPPGAFGAPIESDLPAHSTHGHAASLHFLDRLESSGGTSLHFQGQISSSGILSQPAREQLYTSDYDSAQHNSPFRSSTADPLCISHAMGLENTFLPTERRIIRDEDAYRTEKKRKNEEARIAKEVEAHEKRIRKELEKQDILRRKREEQIEEKWRGLIVKGEKEEERMLRENNVRRSGSHESKGAEKLRRKEEMRREKEAARLKAANERATARRIAKESMELIDDERLELMELAALRKGLPSIISLDSGTLEQLDSFRGFLGAFPPKSVKLKRPFSVQPWINSGECGKLVYVVWSLFYLLNSSFCFQVWKFLITFADVFGLWPFTLDEFLQSLHDYDSRLLGEIHVALLKTIVKDIEDVARTPAIATGTNQSSAANPGGGHPQIVEGAYAWGFNICSWQQHLNYLTWPEVLRQFALSAGFGPQLKKRYIERTYLRDDNEVNDGEDARSRHRLTPGTVKFAAFHVLSLEGSKGLTILEVADRIQKSGLRDLTTSKTPEASIAAALSRDQLEKKIQAFQSGLSDSEVEKDAEDVDDGERDEDSECDGADDAEVDEISAEPKVEQSGTLH
ncbi:hypothetical protein HPP92_023278 [Vanilla planifolia]|uniref:Uncharacterized protein n=1 Tax=Vanilla planifolia TaxID=51239 RepID=A0A835PQ26_VANPL|nr:hypothetical protein HPP92_023278 [Vanilla planifolia]